ncbi:MAG: four helix bundle protein [Parvularculaceae bacterium]
MTGIKSFEDLDVWKKSIDLAEAIYMASSGWPDSERFGIVQQIRRASTSVSANIAEGAERDGTKEFLRFISIANGSLAETRTFVVLAERLKYLLPADARVITEQITEIRRMLAGLTKSLRLRLDTDH